MSLSSVMVRIAQLDSLTGRAQRALDAASYGWTAAATAESPASALYPAIDAPADAATGSGTAVSAGTAPGPGGSGRRFVDVLDAASAPAVSPPATGWPLTVGTEAASQSAGEFRSPVAGGRLTQAFGATSFALEPAATINGVHYAHFHNGIDLAAPLGTPVCAAAAGTVIGRGVDGNGAVIVRIRHADGSVTLYGHLEAGPPVKIGQRVEAGQQIGSVGMTGKTTGPHLHFGLFGADGTPLDPQKWIRSGRLPGSNPATASAPAASVPAAAPVPGSTPAQLAAPAAGGGLVWETTQAALARFDAIAGRIPYASQIRSAAVSAGIDPLLLASLVHAESDFQANVVSKAGAMGLTQLMPATARYLGVADPFDPAQNLGGGAKFLASLLHRFGRVDMALAAYNAGPGAVAAAGCVPARTRPYVNHILNTWTRYSEAAA